jgi:hypothetical protein
LLAVDRDLGGFVDVPRRVRDHLVSNPNLARGDQLLGGAAGGDTCVGEVLGETHPTIEAEQARSGQTRRLSRRRAW